MDNYPYTFSYMYRIIQGYYTFILIHLVKCIIMYNVLFNIIQTDSYRVIHITYDHVMSIKIKLNVLIVHLLYLLLLYYKYS